MHTKCLSFQSDPKLLGNTMKEDRHFFNHVNFDVENCKNMEIRCNNFSAKGKNDTNWAIEQVITFLHFQRKGYIKVK